MKWNMQTEETEGKKYMYMYMYKCKMNIESKRKKNKKKEWLGSETQSTIYILNLRAKTVIKTYVKIL